MYDSLRLRIAMVADRRRGFRVIVKTMNRIDVKEERERERKQQNVKNLVFVLVAFALKFQMFWR